MKLILRTLMLLFAASEILFAAQLRQIAVLEIPGRPGFDRVVFANGMLVMAHSAGDTVDIFDPVKRRVVAQVKGMAGPHGLAVDPVGEKLYVSNSVGKNIAVISTRDWKLDHSIAVSASPYDLVLLPDSRRLLIANWEGRSLSAVDLAGGDKVSTADLNGSPAGLALDAARGLIYASLQDTAEIAVIDTRSLQVTKRFKLEGSQPTGIVLSAPSRRLYVAVRRAVLALDADSGQQVGKATAPAGADSLWLDSPARVLYVASGGGLVSSYRVNGETPTLLQEVRTEIRGHSVAFDPARKTLFVPGGHEGHSKLLILRQLGPPEEEQVANAK